MKKTAYPLDRVHCLLEPGPVLIVSTAYARRRKLMCLSWHTLLEFEPPLLGCAEPRQRQLRAAGCERRVRAEHPHRGTPRCGGRRGQFSRPGGGQVPGLWADGRSRQRGGGTLVEECFANLECRVVDRDLVPRYEMFVLEVVAAWHDPKVRQPRTLHHRGWGEFMVAGESLQSASKMR